MAFSFSIFTNWAVGLINGYKQKDNGLPNDIKYGTMGITTFASMMRTLANFDAPEVIRATSGQKMAGLFIGVPLVMATNFCVGHHLGKAIRYAEDEPSSGKSGVRIQLL
jgi:hypothetical protein